VGLGERASDRDSWALVIGSGWGVVCSAEVDVCSAVGRVSGGERARAGREGLGRERACIECDGDKTGRGAV
jgi:hypothetical protein